MKRYLVPRDDDGPAKKKAKVAEVKQKESKHGAPKDATESKTTPSTSRGEGGGTPAGESKKTPSTSRGEGGGTPSGEGGGTPSPRMLLSPRVLLRLADGRPALTYYPAPLVFTKAEADACYEHMRTKYPWKHDTIVLAGKEVHEPRLTCAHSLKGGTYTYSGRTKVAVPFDDNATFLWQRMKDKFGVEVDYELNNNYVKDQKHQIHFHPDDEKGMDKKSPILSLSLGLTRKFVVMPKQKPADGSNRKRVVEVYLNHGDAVVMHPGMQTEFVHGVPLPTKAEEKRFKEQTWEHRFNVTGRVLSK